MPDWVIKHAEKKKEEEKKRKLQTLQEQRQKLETRLSNLSKKMKYDSEHSAATNKSSSSSTEGWEDEFLVEDYESDEESNDPLKKFKDDSSSEDEDKKEEEIQEGIKIIYCSRTHSQLGQVINELKRLKDIGSVRSVALASRKLLCINSTVSKLQSLSTINEKCLDMQSSSSTASETKNKKKKSVAESKCPFYNKKGQAALADQILVIKLIRSLSKC